MSYLIQYEPNYQEMRRSRELHDLNEHKKNLERQVANLKKKLWRAENPGWHQSKRWGPPLSGACDIFCNAHTQQAQYRVGDNEFRYSVILKPGVSPITYYRRLRKDRPHAIAMMKSRWADFVFFTPFTAKAHKSRRQGKEVWIIAWDIRRDC